MVAGYPEYAITIQDRSQNLDTERYLQTRLLFGKIAEVLTSEGIATFTWDFENTATEGLLSAYDLFRVEISNFMYARKILQTCEDIDMQRTIFLGHDLGSYVICTLAEQGIIARGNVFLSGIYSNYDNVLSYRYNLLNAFMLKHQDGKAIVEASDPIGLTYGLNQGVILQGLRRGKNSVIIKRSGKEQKISLHTALFAGERTPGKIIRYIRTPVLVLQGTGDSDIPVTEAFSLEQSLKLSGNFVERIIIDECDHWYHESPEDQMVMIHERLTGKYKERAYNQRFCREIAKFCKEKVSAADGDRGEKRESPVHAKPQSGYRDLKDLFMKKKKR